jgi:hypothetical protein
MLVWHYNGLIRMQLCLKLIVNKYFLIIFTLFPIVFDDLRF